MSDSSPTDQPSIRHCDTVSLSTGANNNNNSNSSSNNNNNNSESVNNEYNGTSDNQGDMHSTGNGRITHKKSVCPTVTYLNIFPESGDSFKAHENGDGTMKPCKVITQETLHTGKYLQLTKYHFVDSLGNERSAEGVHMVKQVVDQKPPRNISNGHIDIPSKLGNLCTIAVLKKQIMCDSLVLTKQYRAPLKAYTIEFPATVIEKGSLPRDLAAKEIADDTGYSSTSVQYISPLTSLEPDISDGKLQFVSLTIDGDDPLQSANCNNNNQSHDRSNGSHGDIVDVLKVPVNGLLERLERYSEAGYIIDSRVIAFAIGLRQGSNLLKAEAVIENESPM